MGKPIYTVNVMVLDFTELVFQYGCVVGRLVLDGNDLCYNEELVVPRIIYDCLKNYHFKQEFDAAIIDCYLESLVYKLERFQLEGIISNIDGWKVEIKI